MTKRILVLSLYYEPDLSAGSFRTTALVQQLRELGVGVEVITTLPNRYSSFTSSAPEFEDKDGLIVHRVALPSHNSGMLDQIKAFTHFYREARKLTKGRQYDIVYATSSRLFTAFLGARIASKKKLPLYLDVRDIFVDTINDVLSSKLVWLVKPVLSWVERYTFARAERINLVSEGFRDYFASRFPQPEYRFYTNGIDKEFLDVSQSEDGGDADSLPTSEPQKLKVVYAGNIGEGQGLHSILPALARSLGDSIEFTVIGDGGRKTQLQNASAGLSNIVMLPPVKRSELIDIYNNADVLFLHLNDYPAFKKVLPSKIFEYAALGKPILAGVSGYAATFLQENVENAAIFYPGNVEQAFAAFQSLDMKTIDRESFKQQFSRDTIMKKMAKDVISVGSNV